MGLKFHCHDGFRVVVLGRLLVSWHGTLSLDYRAAHAYWLNVDAALAEWEKQK